MNAESEYIAQCKRLIEEKFGFQSAGGVLRQRDLEYLARSIDETSGIRISLSTLKRLWRKDYDQTPHPSTLGALVSLLGYKDWQEFKLKQGIIEPVSQRETTKSNGSRSFHRWMLWPVLAALVVVFWLIAFRSRAPVIKPIVKGEIIFKGNKTVALGVPSTIIFNYDVSNIEADSFFFQQSWNERERVRLDPQGHFYSTIYYYPGFHRAKLIANDTIVSRFRAHIKTDGWLPLLRYSPMDNIPVYIKKDAMVKNGSLNVTRADLAASNVPVEKEFILSYFNVRDFENTHSDNFSLETRLAFDSTGNKACPGVELVIMCEEHIFFVGLIGKGCERDVAIKMGEVIQDGVSSDLSAFGRDMREWQDLRLSVVNKQATIYLGGKPVHNLAFKNDFGKVVGLVYHFNGTGAVDYIKLSNGKGSVVMESDFN